MANAGSEEEVFAWAASRLEGAKSVSPDGAVSFRSAEFDDLLSVLWSATTFPQEMVESDQRACLRSAVFDAGRRTLTGRSIRSNLRRRVHDLILQRRTRFVLATSISLRSTAGSAPRRVLLFGTTIQLTQSLPSKFNRDDLADRIRQLGQPTPDPFQDRAVRVHVRARTLSEASDLALGSLDLLRGMWNFALNRHTWSRGSTSPQPFNSIRLGPIQTLHRPSGRLATENFWYEPEFSNYRAKNLSDRDWRRVKADAKQVRDGIRASNYPEDLKRAFVAYARALDTRDYEKSFLRLWRLMEYLTHCSGPGASHDGMVKRILFTYREKDFNRRIIQHLRVTRNRLVHTHADLSSEMEVVMCQAKRYVEDLLRFHLGMSGKFASLEVAGRFLDQPASRGALQARRDLAEQALHFLR